MDEIIAYCGLNCSRCEAYLATQKGDKEGLAKIATKWSKLYGGDIKPEDVVCDGCTTSSERKTAHYWECDIRVCCQERDLENCAGCQDYDCRKLAEIFAAAPEAKENLERIKV